jgi:hypothetical protein
VFEQPVTFTRIMGYLTMATVLLWTSQEDKIGVLGLAMNACRERDGFADERDRIVELVACARDLWPYAFEPEDEAERLRLRRATFRLIHLAQIETVTADG